MESPMRVLAWLLVAVVLGYLACGTSAQDVDGSLSASLSESASVSIADQNPCSFRGDFLLHKEAKRLDPCTICTCSNGTTTCEIESCPPEPGCAPTEIVIIPEECCPQCPYKMFVENVNNLYEETWKFSEGGSKKIKFELDVEVDKKLTSRIVRGTNLWKLSAWISRNEDGSGQKYSLEENIFSDDDASQEYTKQLYPPWQWSKLRYTANFRGGSCDDYKYFCVKFDEADDPQPNYDLDFTFQPIDNEVERLIDCVPLGECLGLTAVDLDFDLEEREPPLYLQETGIGLDLDVSFTSKSADMRGEGLWRFALFGSRNMDGSGARFREASQILSEGQQATSKKGNNLVISGVNRDFELGSIGCTEDVQYVCVEFAQGDDPDPPFTMVIDTPTNTLIKCKERECAARAIFSELDPELTGDFPAIEGEVNTIRLNLDAITDKDRSTAVPGDSLWTLGTYFSARSNGKGPRIKEISQILDQAQQGIDLVQDENLEFSALDFETDLTGVVCADIPFICFELQKNDAASVDYLFGTNPRQDPFVKCLDFTEHCKVLTAVDLDFDLSERQPPVYGEETGINLDVDVSFTRQSSDMQGEGLWRFALFGSGNSDGSGPRFREASQVLTEGQQATSKTGKNLVINNINRDFEIGSIGCMEDVPYVCVEFVQGDEPDPAFKLIIDTPTNTLIKCKEQECYARAIFSKLAPELTGDFPAIEGEMNTIRLNLDAITNKEESTAVEGDSLWTLGTYFSAQSNGRGRRINEISQILDRPQQGIDLVQDENLGFSALDFQTDLTGVRCADIPYICFELSKNDAASIPYIFGTTPTRDPFVKCVDFSKHCKVLRAVDLDFDLNEREPPSYGEATDVGLNLDVSFTEESANMQGDALWRFALFGSGNRDGSGPRFQEASQILNEDQQSIPKKGDNLVISRVNREFEIGSIGCMEDVPYVCVEFAQGDDPDPPFKLVIDTPTNTLIKCKEQECYAKAIFSDLVPELTGDFPAIEGKTNTIRLNLDAVTDKEQSTSFSGDSLWTLGTYFNSRSDGRGPRVNEISQLLDSAQQGIDLVQDENLEFSALDFETDLTSVDCRDIPYICFELQKNDAASIPYIFGTNPRQVPFVKCVDFSEYCKGIEAVDLDFDLEETEPALYGERTGISLDLDVSFTPESADLDGGKLWRAGLFGSGNIDGSGPRFGEISKILDEGSVGEGKPKTGDNLVFSGLDRNFEIGSIGCTEDVQYVCVEFEQIEDPDPPFKMVIDTPTNSLITCKEQECSARAIFSQLVPELTGDFPAIEGKTNTLRLNLDAITNKDESTAVPGDSLWTLGTYFSAQPNGRGRRIKEIPQILDQSQQDIDLIRDENLEFSALDFETDLTGVVCKDIPYICFELSKNDAASLNYIFGTSPVQDPFVECQDFSKYCKGVIYNGIIWDREIPDHTPGRPVVLTIDSEIQVDPVSRPLSGNGLYEMGVFVASNEDGTGRLTPRFDQVLTPNQMGTRLPAGGPLTINDIRTPPFVVEKLGCGEFKYLCVEFRKGRASRPDYKAEFTQAEVELGSADEGVIFEDDKLISCREEKCAGRLPYFRVLGGSRVNGDGSDILLGATHTPAHYYFE